MSPASLNHAKTPSRVRLGRRRVAMSPNAPQSVRKRVRKMIKMMNDDLLQRHPADFRRWPGFSDKKQNASQKGSEHNKLPSAQKGSGNCSRGGGLGYYIPYKHISFSAHKVRRPGGLAGRRPNNKGDMPRRPPGWASGQGSFRSLASLS